MSRALLSFFDGVRGTLARMADSPTTARARARAETTEQIKQIARRHLAVDGPNLSLRAVARDLGVVSSAVYRYFASRDELLTALILDAYAAMGDAVEQAEAAVAAPRPQRPLAGARPAHPGLGAASTRTSTPCSTAARCPATRRRRTPSSQAQRPAARGRGHPGRRGRARRGRGAGRPAAEGGARRRRGDRAPSPASSASRRPCWLARMTAWAQLYGTISFELFGRYTNAVHDLDAYFEHQLRVMARYLGLQLMASTGTCDPRFAGRARGVRGQRSPTAPTSARRWRCYVDGRPVVDLWGGAGRRARRPRVGARHRVRDVLVHQGGHRRRRRCCWPSAAPCRSTRR